MPGPVASVGPRGLALLVTTGIVGVLLGMHGWSGRQAGATPGTLTGTNPTHPAAAARRSSPTGTPSPIPPHQTRAAGKGPLLSSQSYASYAFQVWPGTPTAAARTAMTGLAISVRRAGAGVTVAAGVRGQPQPAPHTYPHGARVYVIEASLGDEAGNADYNLGDDGLVVTDASGRIVH